MESFAINSWLKQKIIANVNIKTLLKSVRMWGWLMFSCDDLFTLGWCQYHCHPDWSPHWEHSTPSPAPNIFTTQVFFSTHQLSDCSSALIGDFYFLTFLGCHLSTKIRNIEHSCHNESFPFLTTGVYFYSKKKHQIFFLGAHIRFQQFSMRQVCKIGGKNLNFFILLKNDWFSAKSIKLEIYTSEWF